MLGIIFTNGLSVAPHVQHLMISNAQTLYALKILQAHGLCEKSIQAVFRCVIPARFLCTSPAWCCFAGAQDWQNIYGFLCQSTRVGFCPHDLLSNDDLCLQPDESMFRFSVQFRPCLCPHRIISDTCLPDRLSRLTGCNFFYSYVVLPSLLTILCTFFYVLFAFYCCHCILTVCK